MTSKNPHVSMIVAIGKNRVIGRKNELLWHIPDDLKHFKRLTIGHSVIMGRKTWESLPEKLRPLPGRVNIVITRTPSFHGGIKDVADDKPDWLYFTNSLDDAIKKAETLNNGEIFIIGGAQIYEQALPLTDHLYLTVIDDEKRGDAYFPPYEHLFTKKTFEEEREYNGLKYKWVNLER